jgi:uncharacterized membrane protein
LEAFNDFVAPPIGAVEVLRIILAVLLFFFLPGFAWSLLLSRVKAVLERVALSIGLSIALVTLAILGTNIFLDVPITATNTIFIGLALTALPFLIKALLRLKPRLLRKS